MKNSILLLVALISFIYTSVSAINLIGISNVYNKCLISYMIVGYIVSVLSIMLYRKDGTSSKKGDLYLAIIGPFIWPAQVIKWVFDKDL